MSGLIVFLRTYRIPEGQVGGVEAGEHRDDPPPQMRSELIGSLGTIPQEEVAS
jgi:hypothetical protein